MLEAIGTHQLNPTSVLKILQCLFFLKVNAVCCSGLFEQAASKIDLNWDMLLIKLVYICTYGH